jgi:UDP-N-acetyl-D-mannosaminuronic acid dehydrogenase
MQGASMKELLSQIEQKKATVGVIGLGYVGISVASALAGADFRVIGIELKADRVALINAGKCPIEGIEPGLPELIASVTKSGKLTATQDYGALREADVILIDVETPVASDNRPRFEALRSACRALGRVMKDGALVIIESTVAPGTTMGLVAPLLEKHSERKLNTGFFLGHCPERVMPGKLLKNLKELSRVCGGSTPETARAMVALYKHIVQGDLDAADCITAELTKTAENAFRDVNIAFANELGLICEAVGADFRRVRGLVNKSPGRNMLLAGAGVGGHCIPKDPWLLVHGINPEKTPLMATARAVNDSMPLHVARLLEDAMDEIGISVHGSRIAVLGYAYLENTDDVRNSPSQTLIDHLTDWGAECVIHDPWLPEHNHDLWKTVSGAHAAVIMVAHSAYDSLDLARLQNELKAPVLVDGRHMVEADAAVKAGLVFRGLGRGKPSPGARRPAK